MEYFQDDLFPDTRVWWEPALTSDQWFAGKNGAQKRLSLRPADMKPCKLKIISKPCLDKMNITELRVNGLTGFPLTHTCAYFTLKNRKVHTFLTSPRVSGMHKDWLLPIHLYNYFWNPHVFYWPAILSTQGICPPRKHAYSVYWTEKKTDVDPCEISGPKESVLRSKWLYEFSWLMYISTNNHMKCKRCLDAYGCLAKPSQ